MPDRSLLPKAPHKLLVAVGASLAALIVMGGAVTLAVPLRCAIAGGSAEGCSAETVAVVEERRALAPVVREEAAAQPATEVTVKAPVVSGSLSPASPQTASLAPAESLITSTFQRLVAAKAVQPLAKPQTDVSAPVETAALAPQTPETEVGGPTTRRVRTIAVKGNAAGSQSPGDTALASSARANDLDGEDWWLFPKGGLSNTMAGLPDTEVQETEETQVASLEPVTPMPPLERKAEPASKAAASAGDSRIVGGSGVNVRAGASKSRPKLFALTAGQKVTVTDTDKGWLKITDSRGRTGWVYSTFLSASRD